MTRKVNKVPYLLNPREEALDFNEYKAVLRGADELVSIGGRNMLAKILKGSRDKKLLEHQLDQCPVYGFYKDLTIEAIISRIDRVITDGYLKIEYDYRLPVFVYTPKGWEIEIETYAREVAGKLRVKNNTVDYSFIDTLKNRHRGMINRVLEIIAESEDKEYIPALEYWKSIDFKKVQKKIGGVILRLRGRDDKRN